MIEKTPFDYLTTSINGTTLAGAFRMGVKKGKQQMIEWGNGWCYDEKHPRSCSWEVNRKKDCKYCWAELAKVLLS